MKADIKKLFPISKYDEIIRQIKSIVPFEFEIKTKKVKFRLYGHKCDNGLWEKDYIIGIDCGNNLAGLGYGVNISDFIEDYSNYDSLTEYIKDLISRYDEDIIFEEETQLSMF